jgi:hypothetical protein
MQPVALDSCRVTWGGTGAGRLYFQVSPARQVRLEIGPGPDFTVTRIGTPEPKTAWTCDRF